MSVARSHRDQADARLLAHLSALELALSGSPQRSTARLEVALGPELAGKLLFALAHEHGRSLQARDAAA